MCPMAASMACTGGDGQSDETSLVQLRQVAVGRGRQVAEEAIQQEGQLINAGERFEDAPSQQEATRTSCKPLTCLRCTHDSPTDAEGIKPFVKILAPFQFEGTSENGEQMWTSSTEQEEDDGDHCYENYVWKEAYEDNQKNVAVVISSNDPDPFIARAGVVACTHLTRSAADSFFSSSSTVDSAICASCACQHLPKAQAQEQRVNRNLLLDQKREEQRAKEAEELRAKQEASSKKGEFPKCGSCELHASEDIKISLKSWSILAPFQNAGVNKQNGEQMWTSDIIEAPDGVHCFEGYSWKKEYEDDQVNVAQVMPHDLEDYEAVPRKGVVTCIRKRKDSFGRFSSSRDEKVCHSCECEHDH